MMRYKFLVVAALLLSNSWLNGQVLKWAVGWNSSSTEVDLGWAVTTDGSGNVYTVGGAKDQQLHDYSVEIIKYNGTGTQQWATNVNTASTSGNCDQERGYCISVDANGYIWVSAVTFSGTTNYDDLTLIRLNSSGTIQTNYPKRYSVATDNDCDGGGPELGTTLFVYDPTNVYIGGKNFNASTSTWSFIVLKDNVGTANWSWTYTKSGTLHTPDNDHQVTDIKADANYVYATGWIQNTNQAKDIWTVKLSAGTGIASWAVQYDAGANAYGQIPNALGVDNNGNVYVAGTQYTSAWREAVLLKYNSAGVLQSGFPATYNGYASGGDDAWSDIAVLTTGGSIAVYVGGFAYRGSPTCYDYTVAAYTSSGTLASGWSTNPVFYDGAASESSSSAKFDRGYAIEYSSNSNRLYITGRAKENTPNAGDINITTLAYNATNGSNVWSKSYDYGSPDISNTDEMQWKYGMQVKWNSTWCQDEVFIVGDRYTSANNYDILTLKYGPSGNPCEGFEGERSQQGTTNENIYPNPFSDRAELAMGRSLTNGKLLIFDASGRTVRSIENINGDRVLIERVDLLPGIYFYQVSEMEFIMTLGRFVITD